MRYLKGWIEVHKLKAEEKPVLSHCLVAVRNPKTSRHIVRVQDNES